MARPVELQGRRVVVVGAGRSGVAAARLCASRGAQVTLADEKSAAELGAAIAGLPHGVHVAGGPFATAVFAASDLIVLSPGVPPALPAIVAAQQSGVPITGEIELASRFIDAPIVAITGTNGKSTVTTLAGEIARASGRPAFVGGNLGTPLAEVVGADAASQQGVVVCEVSSFQLETADTFHPRAAAILNLTPDHLDRHGSMQGYGDAKMRIAQRLGPGDVLVVNEDDAELMSAVARHARPDLPLVGYSTLVRPRSEVGGFVDGEDLVLRLRAGDGSLVEERYPSADLELVGRHNLGNALAAYLLLRASGLASTAAVREGARRFRPLPHRMQLAGERAGVALLRRQQGHQRGGGGGLDRRLPAPLRAHRRRPRQGRQLHAPARGARAQPGARRGADRRGGRRHRGRRRRGRPRRARGLHGRGGDRAAARALAGDAVVLSPACSSYDMFDNYIHRGRVFRQAVENLPPPA